MKDTNKRPHRNLSKMFQHSQSNQKSTILCEHTVKMVPCDSFEQKAPGQGTERKGGRSRGKMKTELSEVNTRTVCGG